MLRLLVKLVLMRLLKKSNLAKRYDSGIAGLQVKFRKNKIKRRKGQ